MISPLRLFPIVGTFILSLSLPASVCAQTIHLEAESATLSGPSLKVQPAPSRGPLSDTAPLSVGYSGTGYVTGFEQPSDHLLFRFKAKHPGFYSLAVTYRATDKKGYDITVNDIGVSGMFPATPGSHFETAQTGKVELATGENEITINRGWGHFDIDYIELTAVPPPIPPPTPTAEPSDHQVSPEARALLSQLDAAYGKSTSLGVYSDQDADYALTTTGRRPAIMGGDLLRFSSSFAAHETTKADDVARLIADYQAGYTVTLCWHWLSPTGLMDTKDKPWWRGFYTDSTNFDASRAVDPTTPEHAAAITDIDIIAAQLRRLQDARIPVLWRPLHEAQGGWFWWGAKGPVAFKQLWAMLYDRLVNVDGIHNLIWVYTSGDDLNWYPGDAFVDVIGVDEYPSNIHDPESGMWDLLQKQFAGRRPLAIAEFGGVPDIPLMQRYGEFWSYAVSWTKDLGPMKNTPAELTRIYSSPGTTTLPPLPTPPAAPAPSAPAEMPTTPQSP